MKKINFILIISILLLISNSSFEQTNYTFAASSGTFTANSSPTIVYGTCNGAYSFSNTPINIGFNFTFNCQTYSQFTVSATGYIILGSSCPASGTDFSSNSFDANTGYGPIIAPLWDPNIGTDCTSGEVDYKLTGSSGSYVLTIEWLNMDWNWYSTSSPTISYQVKLYQATNKIQFIYKKIAASSSPCAAAIGIGGGVSTGDYISLNGTGTSPTANYGTLTNTLSSDPANGETYTFTPSTVSMAYSSSTCTQNVTASVYRGATAQQIICVKVVEGGGCSSAQTLTQFLINMTGSTAATGDVSKVHMYYTGTSSAFSASNEFVSGGTSPATGTITLNGSQALDWGTNYFWIAYDISSTATGGDVVDAQCTQLTVGGVNKTPAVTNPAGSRPIVSPPGGVATPSVWLEAGSNVTPSTSGSTVTNWNSPTSDILLTQTNAGYGPVYATNAVNFNPGITFTNNSPSSGYWASTDVETLGDGGVNSLTEQQGFVIEELSSSIDPYVGIVHEYQQDNLDLGRAYQTGNTNMYSDDQGGNDLSDATSQTYTNGALSLTQNYEWALCRVTRSAATVSTGVAVGEQDFAHASSTGGPRFSLGSISETIMYPSALTATQTQQVESYLALKYGLTLSQPYNYIASDGTTTFWSNASAVFSSGWYSGKSFIYNIAGIGRDDNGNQSQIKSTSTQSPTSSAADILTGALTDGTGTFASPNTFSTDKNFLVWANDGDSVQTKNNSVTIIYTDVPTTATPALQKRLLRIWQAQMTGTESKKCSMQFDLSGLGALNVSQLYLIIDRNHNGFADDNGVNPGTVAPKACSSVTGTIAEWDGITFQTGDFFTIATTNDVTTPLPMTLLSFNANLQDNNTVDVKWVTGAQINCGQFTVQKTTDGNQWQTVTQLPGAGTTSERMDYEINDDSPLIGQSYYRLQETDYDGQSFYSNTAPVYYMPASFGLTNVYSSGGAASATIVSKEAISCNASVVDMMGRVVYNAQAIQLNIGVNTLQLPSLPNGIYVLSVTGGDGKTERRKFYSAN